MQVRTFNTIFKLFSEFKEIYNNEHIKLMFYLYYCNLGNTIVFLQTCIKTSQNRYDSGNNTLKERSISLSIDNSDRILVYILLVRLDMFVISDNIQAVIVFNTQGLFSLSRGLGRLSGRG